MAVLFLLSVLIASDELAAAEYVVLAGHALERGTDKNSIYMLDMRDFSRRALWHSEGTVCPGDVHFSPENNMIAATSMKSLPGNSAFKNYVARVEYTLHLISRDGKEVKRIPGVASGLAWGPNGKLAYRTQVYSADWEEQCTGTWIYDLRSDVSTKISENGASLGWNKNDGNLYVQFVDGVKKYDCASGSFSVSLYLGTQFSPDGSYYYSSELAGKFLVFSTDSNQDVTPENLKQMFPYRWLADHILLYRAHQEGETLEELREEINYLFDCEEGMVREVTGTAVAFTDGGKSLVVAKLDHTLEKVAVADLKVVWTRQTEPASPSGSPVPDPSAEPVQK